MVSFADEITIIDDKKKKQESKRKIHVTFCESNNNDNNKNNSNDYNNVLYENKYILPTNVDKKHYTFHLGMLKIGHIYETTLQLNHNFGNNFKIKNFQSNDMTLIDCKPIIAVKNKDNNTNDNNISEVEGHYITIYVNPKTPLLFKDFFEIHFNDTLNNNNNNNDNDNSNDSNIIYIQVSAKVLRQDQGTPLLKSGIRCIKRDTNEETDYSEIE